MKKVIIIILLVLGIQRVCSADTWSEMLRAYKMDLSTLARGNGYQIFRSEAGGLGIAYSEIDVAGQCHFSLAMVPVEARGLRWLPGAGANYLEIRVDDAISGVLALQEVKGPDTDPKLGSFCYVVEPRIFVGPDGQILNLGYYGDKLLLLVQRDSGVFWVGEDGKKVDIPAVNPPASPAAPTGTPFSSRLEALSAATESWTAMAKTALSGPRSATPRNTIWRTTTSFFSR